MKVIAEKAGVSIMTVSRVLSGTGRASPETTERIKKIADEMKYRPNRLVRGMQTGRTGLVGLVLPSDLGYYKNILVGVHNYCCEQDSGVMTSLVDGNMGDAAMADERSKLHRLVDLRIDGVILRPVNDEASSAYYEELVERSIPLVVVDRRMSNYKCDFVGTDDRLGGQLAAEHMQRRKPKRVLIFSATDTVSTSRERVEGFREVFKGKRCKLVEHAFGQFTCSEEAMETVLRKELPADGIFCVGDLIAIRCLRVLERMGVSVPEDTGIVGFGNLGLPGDYGTRLTTFDQNPTEIGRQAAQLLESRIENRGKRTRAKSILVPPTLVDMGTC
jgi:LacI family transcriptional regulator